MSVKSVWLRRAAYRREHPEKIREEDVGVITLEEHEENLCFNMMIYGTAIIYAPRKFVVMDVEEFNT